jgi:hypothetical protein
VVTKNHFGVFADGKVGVAKAAGNLIFCIRSRDKEFFVEEKNNYYE